MGLFDSFDPSLIMADSLAWVSVSMVVGEVDVVDTRNGDGRGVVGGTNQWGFLGLDGLLEMEFLERKGFTRTSIFFTKTPLYR